MRRQNQRDHDPAKQACPSLFDPEAQELIEQAPCWPLRRPLSEPRLNDDEMRQRRPKFSSGCVSKITSGVILQNFSPSKSITQVQ